MNASSLDQIVHAVLYEGYILYPYRPSSQKNRRERFTFGRVYPEAYSLGQNGAEICLMQTQCLVSTGNEPASLEATVRFLQPLAREIGVPEEEVPDWSKAETRIRVVPELRAGNELFQTWLEAIERSVSAPPLALDSTSARSQISFRFPGTCTFEPIFENGTTIGVIRRRQTPIEGTIEIAAEPRSKSLFRITARILNQTPVSNEELGNDEAVLLRTFASTHTILQAQGGAFVSLMDPPAEHKSAADTCANIGTWPVLVGNEELGERDTMLSSPIILYDYPKIAPESSGPLFDGTEIDEILTLRILTMTDQEKLEMRRVDEQARLLLERTESLPGESLLKLHGAMRAMPPETTSGIPAPASEVLSLRLDESAGLPGASGIEFDDFFGANTRIDSVSIRGVSVRAGDRVRIEPKARADVMDLALRGRTAIVEAVEQDAERRIHVAVVLEDDPGMDLGLLRQPGHRFFYTVDEVQPLPTPVT